MLYRRLLTVLVLAAGCSAKEAAKSAAVAPSTIPEAPRIAPIARLAALPAATRATESAGIAVATIDARPVVFVADADDRAVVTLDAQTLTPLARTELGAAPRDLLVLERGVLLATLPEANAVAVLESAGTHGELAVDRRIATSTEPLAMAVSVDGKKVAVTAGAGHRVDMVAADTLATESTHLVPREPRAVMFAANDKLFITHATQGALTSLDDALTTDTTPATSSIELSIPNGSFDRTGSEPPRRARHADALVRIASVDGEKIYVPLVQNAPEGGAPPGGYGGARDFGWMMEPPPSSFDFEFEFDGPVPNRRSKRQPPEPQGPPNRMSAFDVRVVDAATAKLADTTARRSDEKMHVPELLRSCLLPRAAVATSTTRILVACAGESEVIALDASAPYPRVVGRLATGRGPTAIARADEAHVVVWSPLSRTVVRSAAELDAEETAATTFEVPRVVPLDEKIVLGRELFMRTGDPRISKDGLACATCHPDGRDDGLVWQTPLGERRPRTLAGNVGVERTTPYGWAGEQPTIHAHVKQTLKRLRGTGLPPEELDAVFAYLRSLPPVPAADLPRTPSELRGAQVFASERAGCATCHDPENGFTDNSAHAFSYNGPSMTPSLLGVGSRGSLFHTGRYRSFTEMFRGESGDEYVAGMGGLRRLDADDRRDLEAYLRTL